ncbi:hypothetical protein ACHWQZ_G010307 [Mnemiopsis leidyi]
MTEARGKSESPDDTRSTQSDSDSSLGSSVVILPCLNDEVSPNFTDEISLNPGSESELREQTPSSPGSSVVVVGESREGSTAESEEERRVGEDEDGAELDEEEGLYRAETEVWLSSSDQNVVKRRRVFSEPSSRDLRLAGLSHSVLFDQLSDLVGVQRSSNWGSDHVDTPAPSVSVPTWGSDQGSVSGAPPPSTASTGDSGDVINPPRTTYTDEFLNGVFHSIVENIQAYSTEYDLLKDAVRRLVEENDHIKGKVYLLEWECDNFRQDALSNRILIINVPTKLKPMMLKQLVIRVAHRVGVFLELEDIRDVFYLFRRPSRTSPVIVIFMEHALGARRQILARKNILQHLPMKTLEGFGRYSNTICVDEQLIGRRNELKQAARRVMKQGRVLDTWVLNGNVFVRDNQKRKHLIESEEALDKVLEDY